MLIFKWCDNKQLFKFHICRWCKGTFLFMFDNHTNLGIIREVLKVEVKFQKLVLKIEHFEEENSQLKVNVEL